MKRAVLYLRVSTIDQTTANQERELREVAGRMGCEIVRACGCDRTSFFLGRVVISSADTAKPVSAAARRLVFAAGGTSSSH